MPKGLPYSLANIQATEANTIAATISAASATTLVQSATALDDATLSLDVAESVTTSGTPTALSLATFQSNITTGGTAGTESVTLGTSGIVTGQRKLVTLSTRTDGSDVVSLDHANIVNANGVQCTNVDLDAANEYVLLEWNGSKWKILAHNATVAPTEDSTHRLDSDETVTGAGACSILTYKSTIVTGGTAGTEAYTIGDGTGAILGQRKLIELGTRTDGSDVVSLDHANIVNSAGVQCTNVDLDAAAEYVLLEWNGSKWQIVHSNGTVAPTGGSVASLTLDGIETVTGAGALSISVYRSNIVTGGTAGTEAYTVGDGTGATIGQRKLVYMTVRTDGSDVASLDHANIVNASGTPYTNLDLDAADEYVLLEWNGAKWQTVYTNGTEAT